MLIIFDFYSNSKKEKRGQLNVHVPLISFFLLWRQSASCIPVLHRCGPVILLKLPHKTGCLAVSRHSGNFLYTVIRSKQQFRGITKLFLRNIIGNRPIGLRLELMTQI